MRSVIFICLVLIGTVYAAPPKSQEKPKTAPEVTEEDVVPDNYPAPQIDWGKCPQLKPTDADKEQKRLVIQKCLEQNPAPAVESITDPKQIDDHREVVTTCALKSEGWFNTDGTYKFDRARKEIESKKLEKEVEKNISKKHQECQEEAVKRFPGGYIEQVQLYQACMDYHIAEICEIELIPPPGFPIEEYIDYDDILPESPQAALGQFQGQPQGQFQGQPQERFQAQPQGQLQAQPQGQLQGQQGQFQAQSQGQVQTQRQGQSQEQQQAKPKEKSQGQRA